MDNDIRENSAPRDEVAAACAAATAPSPGAQCAADRPRYFYAFFKRAFDIVSSGLALLLLSWLILICIFVKWLEDAKNSAYELVIDEADAFNGYYLDGTFENVEVEVDMRRLSGAQSFIAGVGVKDVEDRGTMDCNGFSVSCQYGKNHKGYSPEGNTLRIVYTRKKMTCSFLKDGVWHFLFEKNVWRVNERVFQTATFDGDKIYLKVVNVSGEAQPMRAEIAGFGEKKRARVVTLADPDENVINEISDGGVRCNICPQETAAEICGNVLEYTLAENSVTVFVIE